MIKLVRNKRLPYEAPEVNLTKVDSSSSLMQSSIEVPTALLGLPEIEVIEDEIMWL